MNYIKVFKVKVLHEKKTWIRRETLLKVTNKFSNID